LQDGKFGIYRITINSRTAIILLRLHLGNKFAAANQPNLRLVHLLLLSRRLRTFLFWARLAEIVFTEKEEEALKQLSEKRLPGTL